MQFKELRIYLKQSYIWRYLKLEIFYVRIIRLYIYIYLKYIKINTKKDLYLYGKDVKIFS